MLANQQGTSLADAQGKLRLESAEYRRTLGWIQDAVKGEPGHPRALPGSRPTSTPSTADSRCSSRGRSGGRSRRSSCSRPPRASGGPRRCRVDARRRPQRRDGRQQLRHPRQGEEPGAGLAAVRVPRASQEPGYTAVYGPNASTPAACPPRSPFSPALKPDKPLFEPIDALGGQDLWKVAVEAAATIPAAAPIPWWWAQSVDYLGDNIQRLIEGKMTPDEVIAESAEKIQRNLIDRPDEDSPPRRPAGRHPLRRCPGRRTCSSPRSSRSSRPSGLPAGLRAAAQLHPLARRGRGPPGSARATTSTC